MQISMSLPQARRHEAMINGEVQRLLPGPHALLEVLLMNRGRYVEWATICMALDMLPHDGWRARLADLRRVLGYHGVPIDHVPRTGLRLPLDVERIHKLKVAA